MNILTILKSLSNEKRLQIFQWLKEPKKYFKSSECDVEINGVCVGLIANKIGLSQSTVSEYLKILEEANLIFAEYKGQWTFYKRNEKTIKAFIKKLNEL